MSDLIVLCPNPFRDTGLELTLQAKALLETNGYRTEICPVFGADDPEAIPAEVKISDWAAVSNEAATARCSMRQDILTIPTYLCSA